MPEAPVVAKLRCLLCLFIQLLQAPWTEHFQVFVVVVTESGDLQTTHHSVQKVDTGSIVFTLLFSCKSCNGP